MLLSQALFSPVLGAEKESEKGGAGERKKGDDKNEDLLFRSHFQ